VAGGDDGGRPDVRRAVARDARRRARRQPGAATFWRSLSVLGTVGWSIALPAAGGALLGHRLDAAWDTGVRFTLMLLVAGVALGAALAWHVVGGARR
jgi:ATP synthase protein I